MIQGIRLEFEDVLPVQTPIPKPIKFSDKDSEPIDPDSFLVEQTFDQCFSCLAETLKFFLPN